MAAPIGNKNAEIPFDKALFEGLCHIQCTQTEIAATLRMSVDTLESKVKQEYEGRLFSEVFAQKREGGKQSLRRAQWTKAIEGKGDTIMQIFLGKNTLSQADKQEITGANGGPIEHTDLSSLPAEDLLTLKLLLEKAGNKEA